MLANPVGIMLNPRKQWRSIADQEQFGLMGSVLYSLVLAAIPSVAWYYGTTQIGWTVGDDQGVTRLTSDSALRIIIAFYCAMVASIIVIGYSIHWMAVTYGAESTTAKGVFIAGLAATPMFVAGAVGFLPVFWVALVIAIVAVSYSVYLLYLGIPIVMGIPPERGFLFASAVIAVCLVILMVIMGGSVILWDMGLTPHFTD